MPYIKPESREHAIRKPLTVGELNFAITHMVVSYLERQGVCYETLNDCVGVLECCKAEFYRRVVVPYEETKRKENGDCYGELV